MTPMTFVQFTPSVEYWNVTTPPVMVVVCCNVTIRVLAVKSWLRMVATELIAVAEVHVTTDGFSSPRLTVETVWYDPPAIRFP